MSIGASFSRFRLRSALLVDLAKHAWRYGELRELHPASVMLVCSDGDRGFTFGGKKYAQVLDSVNDRLLDDGVRTLTVSLPLSHILPCASYGSVFLANGLLTRAMIDDRLTAFGTRTSQGRNKARIEAWAAILDRVKPRAIVGINPPIELCIAARTRGLWIADLQHGILSDEGFYGMGYRASYDQAGWPSCILCWNSASERWVKERIGGHVKTAVIGSPWFIRFRYPRESDKLVDETVTRFVPAETHRLTILVTLQWGISEVTEHRESFIPAGLLDYIKRNGDCFDWWLRVHPVSLQGKNRAKTFAYLSREFAGYSNVSWEQCTDLPLPLVLRHVDRHMTLHSAVTIEAGWFGIKTALLSDKNRLLHDWLGAEIRSGSAEIVSTESAQITQWIERSVKLVADDSSADGMDERAFENFIANLKSSVQKVILEGSDTGQGSRESDLYRAIPERGCA